MRLEAQSRIGCRLGLDCNMSSKRTEPFNIKISLIVLLNEIFWLLKILFMQIFLNRKAKLKYFCISYRNSLGCPP